MIKGFDMSALAYMKECGARYYADSKEEDALRILKNKGANLIRLRLFNDPYDENGHDYGAGLCDLKHLKKNILNCQENGLDYYLDFFYSDCWADPGKQRMPKVWIDHDIDELEKDIYGFTYKTLGELDYLPKIVSIGNEITNGMCWPIGSAENRDNLNRLVSAGLRAVHDFDMGIKTMIHLDNGTNNGQYHAWFDAYEGFDFDYIGMSYYPIWNDSLSSLAKSIEDIYATYGKQILVAETSYPFSDEDYGRYEDIPEKERKGMALRKEHLSRLPYEISPKGQKQYMTDLMHMIDTLDCCLGFCYWGAELIPAKGSSWATYEGIAYMQEKGPLGNEWANQAVFDYEGKALEVLDTLQEND